MDRVGDGSCAAISIDGVPVAAKNDRQPVRPASNVKLITAAVAAEEFKQKLTADAYRGAMEKEKLDVLNLVKVDGADFAPGKAATVTFIVDVRPEFTLPAYLDLPTEIAPTEPTEAPVHPASV